MSILEKPRIVFGGHISWDPIVTNNYPNLYDEDTAWTLFKQQESVKQFRQRANSKEWVITKGNWNPQGTHRSVFYDTYVNGVDTDGTSERTDPFVGRPVNFEGMLVDCEPYGPFSSQLFFNQFSLGIAGGYRIHLPRSHRFTARYINFYRLPSSVYQFAASGASVNWQTAFAKSDGLSINALDSPALQSLETALQEPDVLGLTVRFTAYSTHYFGTDNSDEIPALEQELIDNLTVGGFQPNPARSTITGVVGLWRKGEPIHEPGDRALLAVQSGSPHYVGTAQARLTDTTLTVDMSSSISEIDLQKTKQDLGPLTFSAVDSTTGTKTTLATMQYNQYDRVKYEAASGIVNLPLDGAKIAAANAGELLMEDGNGTVYLKEEAMRAIPGDPNLYINYDEQKSTNVLVLNKGKPVGAGIAVYMAPVSSSAGSVSTQMTNADGIASFSIRGVKGQVEGYVFAAPTPANSHNLTPLTVQTTTYMYIRTLPGTNAIAILAPTWENVYRYCLSNWNAMAPCMDNWLDLNNEEQVKAFGPMLKKLTDPANFEDYRFMPVTRDMTATERNLLYAFLDSDGTKTARTLESTEDTAQSFDLDELARKMRSK